MAAEYELFEPPNDAISSVVFHPSRPEVLMVSSWDTVPDSCHFIFVAVSSYSLPLSPERDAIKEAFLNTNWYCVFVYPLVLL
jgi:hypothetical protein